MWRPTSFGELLGPFALAAGLWVLYLVTQVTRGSRGVGAGALEAWAVSPNSGYWVVPAAAGAAGTMIAVLANVLTTAWSAVCVHLMRSEAPVPQRRATTWVDQSPILASVAGLVLLAIAPAPAWSSARRHAVRRRCLRHPVTDAMSSRTNTETITPAQSDPHTPLPPFSLSITFSP